MRQLVFRANISSAAPASFPTYEKYPIDVKFIAINSGISTFKNLNKIIAEFGFSANTLKLLVKLISGRNTLYFLCAEDKVVSHGLISYGHCKHYPVEKNDCIIGPVNTDPTQQGKGFATFALVSCLKYLEQLGSLENAFIDTREDNFAMQKVIEKSGFGPAISSYDRSNKPVL